MPTREEIAAAAKRQLDPDPPKGYDINTPQWWDDRRICLMVALEAAEAVCEGWKCPTGRYAGTVDSAPCGLSQDGDHKDIELIPLPDWRKG